MRQGILFLIRMYQFLFSRDHSFWAKSLNHPPYCRFFPSCSMYAHESIERFGIWKGLFLSFKRIIRCHPWSKGGIDRVPKK